MITTIVSSATRQELMGAVDWVSDQLHVPWQDINPRVAVAYICKHFEQGAYSGWDGWIEMRKADAPKAPEKYRLACILVNGDFRIHGEHCKDIPKDAAQSDAGAWHIEVTSRHAANIDCWGDVSSDNYEEGTPEWHAECDKNAAMASRYLPCVPKSLPDN